MFAFLFITFVGWAIGELYFKPIWDATSQKINKACIAVWIKGWLFKEALKDKLRLMQEKRRSALNLSITFSTNRYKLEINLNRN